MKARYSGRVSREELIDFEEIQEIVREATKIDSEQRPDFLGLFAQKIVMCKKPERLLGHIRLEEMNEEEVRRTFMRGKVKKSQIKNEEEREEFHQFCQKFERELEQERKEEKEGTPKLKGKGDQEKKSRQNTESFPQTPTKSSDDSQRKESSNSAFKREENSIATEESKSKRFLLFLICKRFRKGRRN